MSVTGTAAIGVGVAGAGAMGGVHAQNLAGRVPGARLVRLAERLESRARAAGRALGVGWSTSFGDLLSDPRVDAVVIATPASTHAELIEAAAGAGKHVFCEKPLSDDVKIGEGAVRAARRAGVALQLGFHRRFDPDFVAARRHLDRGDLGRVRLYLSRMRNEMPPSGSALESGEHRLLFDAACHELDAARWLVGEIEEISVVSDDRPHSAILSLRFSGGALGSVELTYLGGYGFDCQCEIVGEHASVRVASPHVDGPELFTPGAASRGVPRTFLDRFRQAYRLELAGFAEAIRAGREPVVTGEDGLAAVALCEAAERSRVERRSVALRRAAGPERPATRR